MAGWSFSSEYRHGILLQSSLNHLEPFQFRSQSHDTTQFLLRADRRLLLLDIDVLHKSGMRSEVHVLEEPEISDVGVDLLHSGTRDRLPYQLLHRFDDFCPLLRM